MKELLEALRAEVRALVREELARTGVAVDAYSSANLPPGVTARTFGRWCRSGRVLGAVRDGAGWRCSAGAWREARAGGPERPSKPLLTVVPNDDASSILERAGLRRTR